MGKASNPSWFVSWQTFFNSLLQPLPSLWWLLCCSLNTYISPGSFCWFPDFWPALLINRHLRFAKSDFGSNSGDVEIPSPCARHWCSSATRAMCNYLCHGSVYHRHQWTAKTIRNGLCLVVFGRVVVELFLFYDLCLLLLFSYLLSTHIFFLSVVTRISNLCCLWT